MPSPFADGTTTQATLNVASEITALKTRANQTLGYSYDASSRETARTTPTGAYVFAYDREGKRTSAAFTPSGEAARATTYTYDNYGRVTTEGRHDGKHIQYEYDDAGNRTAIQWPDNYRAEYIYDAQNRPVEVKVGFLSPNSMTTIARYTYDFLGRRTQLAFGPTAGAPVSSTAYGYEDDNDLVRLEHRFDSGALVKVIRHAYDKSGKLKSSATNDSAWAPVQPAGTRTYAAANVLDQYTTVTDGSTATLAYDLNGNLTSDGTWTFAYDAENRLLSATKAGASVEYTYDALGRRQTKTVNGTLTNYLSAGDEEIAEYDASGNMLRRYIPGPGTDQPVAMVTVSGSTNTIRFFHADRQGSVVAMADATGALVEGPFTYDPYGNSANSSAGVPFRYTGRKLDAETGLYYYRARYYSASLGRFLQTDPIGYESGMNLYGYTGNDPFNRVDPSGLTDVDYSTTYDHPSVQVAGKKFDLPNMLTVLIHGPAFSQKTGDKSFTRVDIRTLIQTIKSKGGSDPILLLSCRVGTANSADAQRIAKETGRPVIVSTRQVWISQRSDGTIVTESFGKKKDANGKEVIDRSKPGEFQVIGGDFGDVGITVPPGMVVRGFTNNPNTGKSEVIFGPADSGSDAGEGDSGDESKKKPLD